MKTDKEPEAFLERMRERLNDKPEASHTGKHRAAFTAVRPLIELALAHGYTMKATWEGLRDEKKLSMSYQAFRTYCRETGIGRAPQSGPMPSQPRQGPIRPAASSAGASNASDSADGAQRAFRHDRVPRKGDIYG